MEPHGAPWNSNGPRTVGHSSQILPRLYPEMPRIYPEWPRFYPATRGILFFHDATLILANNELEMEDTLDGRIMEMKATQWQINPRLFHACEHYRPNQALLLGSKLIRSFLSSSPETSLSPSWVRMPTRRLLRLSWAFGRRRSMSSLPVSSASWCLRCRLLVRGFTPRV